MVITENYIENLRTEARLPISQELEQILIDRLGQEDTLHIYSEQDVHEQARKIINRYQTPKGRLELLYGYDELEREMHNLEQQIQQKLETRKETENDVLF